MNVQEAVEKTPPFLDARMFIGAPMTLAVAAVDHQIAVLRLYKDRLVWVAAGEPLDGALRDAMSESLLYMRSSTAHLKSIVDDLKSRGEKLDGF